MSQKKYYLSIIMIYILYLISPLMLNLALRPGNSYFISTTVISFLLVGIMLFLSKKFDKEKSPLSVKAMIKNTFITTIILVIVQLAINFGEKYWLHINAASNNTNFLVHLTHQYPYYLLVILIFTPIMEELVFRKVMIDFFNLYFKPQFGIVVSSLVFAFAHQDNLFLIYFITGLILGFVYNKTKDVKVTIFSHIITNIITILVTF